MEKILILKLEKTYGLFMFLGKNIVQEMMKDHLFQKVVASVEMLEVEVVAMFKPWEAEDLTQVADAAIILLKCTMKESNNIKIRDLKIKIKI